jgi:hypothetical protein
MSSHKNIIVCLFNFCFRKKNPFHYRVIKWTLIIQITVQTLNCISISINSPQPERCNFLHCAPNRIGRAAHSVCVFHENDTDMIKDHQLNLQEFVVLHNY